MGEGLYLRQGCFEKLEARIAPATLLVTNTADSGEGSLRAAIEQANHTKGRDVIVFSDLFDTPQTISLISGELLITDSLDIRGTGASNITIDGNQLSRIFHIDDSAKSLSKISLSALTLSGGNAAAGEGPGGAIANHDSLELRNVVIQQSTADEGSAVYSSTLGDFTITDSLITGNTSTGVAGLALFFPEGGKSTVKILNTHVTGNSGGGIYIYSYNDRLDLHIQNTIVSHNTSTQSSSSGLEISVGGHSNKLLLKNVVVSDNQSRSSSGMSVGSWAEKNAITLEGITVTRNTSLTSGSGLEVGIRETSKGKASISNSEVSRNTSVNGGLAGMCIGNVTAKISSVLVFGNTADEDSGICIFNSHVTLADSVISGNTGRNGGGIFADESSVKISNTDIVGNTATQNGGGLFLDDVKFSLKDTRISGNHAALDGGGAWIYSSKSVSLKNVELEANTAVRQGGGLAIFTNAKASVSSSIFKANSSGEGGAIMITAEKVSIDKSQFIGNSATNGGALAIDAEHATVKSSYIVSNYALQNGGGIIANASKALVKNSDITANIAGEKGGGIFSTWQDTLTTPGSTISGNLAPIDPDISETS